MTPERFARIKQVLDRRQPDLTVITDQVHKERNLAAIIRTCDATGIDTIHCVTPEEGYQRYSGTSASADKWVSVEHHDTVEQAIKPLNNEGYQIVAAALSHTAVDYREVDYTKKTALLLGAEIKGVSQDALGHVDYEVVLPMLGMVESLNVSVACALILAEARGQRERAHMYDQPRLPLSIYKKRLLHWAHPKVAQFCDEQNVPYPEVCLEDGELVDGPAWRRSMSYSKS